MHPDPQEYTLPRFADLPLVFRGVLHAEETLLAGDRLAIRLALYRTVGGTWVAVYSTGQPPDHTVSLHTTLADAVDSFGVGTLALRLRERLGFPLVERVA